MNILPHKSWHVRTKKNIARVRADEAKAAEEEKERQRKIALAGQEARTAILRQRASQRLAGAAESAQIGSSEVVIPLAPVTDIVQKDGHVNFFQDIEDGKRQEGGNKDAEQETKKEQEDYEKKIGYLVYLGQDSIEQSKQKPWYAKIDRSKDKEAGVLDDFNKIKQFEQSSGYLEGFTSKDCKLSTDELKLAKFKSFQDPLKDIRKYLKTPGVAKTLIKASGSLKRKAEESSISVEQFKQSNKKLKKEKKHKSKKKKSKNHSHHHKKSKNNSSEKSGDRRKKDNNIISKTHSSSDSKSDSASEDSEQERKQKTLLKLRQERLEREREEKRRTEQLFAKLRGDKIPSDSKEDGNEKHGLEERNIDGAKGKQINNEGRSKVKQKYNAQFNPELARQNYDFR